MKGNISIFKKLFWVLMVLLLTATGVNAASVQANSEDISENLNLEAIASLFGEVKHLEEFEKKLNDPELQLSNLDLNADGNVDYLRVVESYEGSLHVIIIQAVLAKDTFQDVATIEADKDENNKEIVQVIGDPYIYGPDYVIEPVYVERPAIFVFFWASAMYHAYFSPYYWGYYPPYFHHWHPRPPYFYHRHIHNHINSHHTYHRGHRRKIPEANNLQKKLRKNDYAVKYPNKSHLNKAVAKPSLKPAVKPQSIVKPAKKPSMKPAAETRPSSNPIVKPKPMNRPVTKPRPVSIPKPMIKPRPMSMPRPMARPAAHMR